MIICNGTIQVKIKSGGGFDEEGNPIKVEETFGEIIPCHIRPLRYNNLAFSGSGSNYINASYEVLIEIKDFQCERIKLINRYGKDLGEYSVISAENLEAVCATKIIV
jgi:hypothetical protein